MAFVIVKIELPNNDIDELIAHRADWFGEHEGKPFIELSLDHLERYRNGQSLFELEFIGMTEDSLLLR